MFQAEGREVQRPVAEACLGASRSSEKACGWRGMSRGEQQMSSDVVRSHIMSHQVAFEELWEASKGFGQRSDM